MGGKPVIDGTRLTVTYIMNLRAHGAPAQEILDEYPNISPEDLRACDVFAERCYA